MMDLLRPVHTLCMVQGAVKRQFRLLQNRGFTRQGTFFEEDLRANGMIPLSVPLLYEYL